MMKQQCSILQKGDLFVILFILLLAVSILLFIFYPKAEKIICIISQNNVIMTSIDLTNLVEQQEIVIGGDYHNTVVIENGRVCIAHSDCPNQFCMNTGWVDSPEQSIVCLPNHVLIQIVSAQEGGIDAVAK